MKQLLFFFFMFCFFAPSAQALTCGRAFALSPTSEKNLTQIYIHRNAQFPLNSTLIQAALVADIVSYNVQLNSTMNYSAVARALNRMHKKYDVPVRIEVANLHQEPGVRYLQEKDLRRITEQMLYVSFKGLMQGGYLDVPLSRRQLLFWHELKLFFDSPILREYSRQYRYKIKSPMTREDLLKVKSEYFQLVISEVFIYLERRMPNGLNLEERNFLSSSSIFK